MILFIFEIGVVAKNVQRFRCFEHFLLRCQVLDLRLSQGQHFLRLVRDFVLLAKDLIFSRRDSLDQRREQISPARVDIERAVFEAVTDIDRLRIVQSTARVSPSAEQTVPLT